MSLFVDLNRVFYKKDEIITSWESTPSDSKVASEKLVKDSLDGKAEAGHTHSSYLTSSDISGKIDAAGTGLSKSGTTLNHSNSVTALTTTSLKKVKYDAQGHITGTSDVAGSDLPSHTHKNLEKTTITSGSLDDYTDTGWYSYSTTNSSSITNTPENVGSVMEVLDDYGNGQYIIQKVYPINSDKYPLIYIRIKYASSGWGDWKIISNSDHTHGNLSSDGKISNSNSDTFQYFVGIGNTTNSLYKAHNLRADKVKDINEHTNISTSANATQDTINTAIDNALSGKIDTAGTGLSKSGTTLNHSNSVTALTTASLKKVKYDAQGHITGTSDVTSSDLPSHTHEYLSSSDLGLSSFTTEDFYEMTNWDVEPNVIRTDELIFEDDLIHNFTFNNLTYPFTITFDVIEAGGSIKRGSTELNPDRIPTQIIIVGNANYSYTITNVEGGDAWTSSNLDLGLKIQNDTDDVVRIRNFKFTNDLLKPQIDNKIELSDLQSLLQTWESYSLNTYATLYVNHTLQQCELYYARSFSSGNANNLYNWGTGLIPSEYRPSHQVTGVIDQLGTCYVDASGNFKGRFTNAITSSTACKMTVQWHY